MNILLTGGMGYIGSHTAVELAQAGHRCVLYDNLSGSSQAVGSQLQAILGEAIPFVKGDVRDTALLSHTIKTHAIDAVLHFAGLKSLAESVREPAAYYSNNVQGTISLLDAMREHNIKTLVFSSSATVYGIPDYVPVDEAHPVSALNPYGRTKLHIEEMLADIAGSEPGWRIASLRYFNPAGSHDSGLIGETLAGTPNNLMPNIMRAALGLSPHVHIFGDDYDTPDGTGVRDYIHITDLAAGHVAALRYLCAQRSVHETINLGTGKGHSVFEAIRSFEAASGKRIPYIVAPRRGSDVASCYADASKAQRLLGWRAERSLGDMCASAWRFASRKQAA